MKVLRVSKQPPTQLEANTLEQYGIIMAHTSPTLLSAITAMKIAKAADRHDVDIVTVSEQADAVAALSARKIAKNQRFKVIYAPAPNTDGPRTLHREVAEGVDGWLFVSERQHQSFPSGLRHAAVIAPVSYCKTDICAPVLTERHLVVSWIGDIVDSQKLKELVEIIDNTDAGVTLRICGAGRGRDVMPVVRYTKAIAHPERIIWVGEEYNKDQEIEACHCAVRTARDMTEIETEILMSGRPVIEPDEITAMVNAPTVAADISSLNNYIINLRQYYTGIINETQQQAPSTKD